MLNELRDKIHENAKAHGFYDDETVNIPEKLMLIVSELGEAMEAYRKDNYAKLVDPDFHFGKTISFEDFIKDTFEDEIADTLIRILDLCGYMKIDIENHVAMKMKYNATRPYKHGKKC